MTSSDNKVWFPLGPLARAEPESSSDHSTGKSRFARLTSVGQEALGRLRTGSQAPDESTLLHGFAAANVMTFHSQLEAAAPSRSLVLTGAHNEVMITSSGPVVEFGNHGEDRWYQSNRRPSRHGYIAVRHGLPLPHLFVRSSAASPMTSGRIAADAVGMALLLDVVTGGWKDADADGDGAGSSPLTQFITQSPRLKDFPAKVSQAPGKRATAPFRVHVPKTDHDGGAAFAKGVAAPLLQELGPWFDLEIRDEWIFAYACDGDIVTTDPARWAWAMATASRLLEFTHHMISTQGSNPPGWDLTDVGFYTPQRVDYVAPPQE